MTVAIEKPAVSTMAPPAGGMRAAQAARAKKAAGATGIGGEYLTFRLGTEEYGIDILKVQEIRSYEAPTRIANSPEFLKGVVNLRGVIVPIIDLRLKLGCDKAELNDFTVVIVLSMHGRVVGAVVDSVSDVTQLPADAVQPAPDMSALVDMTFIQGIAKLGERMLILMDIESLLSSSDLRLIEAVA